MAKRSEPAGVWDGLDPYVSWALGPGRDAYFAEGRVMSLLVRLRGELAQDFLDGTFIEPARRRARWKEAFRVLGRRRDEGTSRDATVWAGALVTEKIARSMASLEARRAIVSVSLGPPVVSGRTGPRELLSSRPAGGRRLRRPARSVGPGGAPPAVVMGIIDDAIAFANERFQMEIGGIRESRVEYCRVQSLSGPDIELTKPDIDSLIATCNGNEELLYRRSGLVDLTKANAHHSVAWRAAHGTHVMDLACGFDPKDQVDDRPIVCVQLPTEVTARQEAGSTKSIGTLYFHIATAIEYILGRALAIAAARGVSVLPVVINVSYGLLADPHDGTGDLEAFIDDKIDEYLADHAGDLRVVLPAGNSYLSRIHGQASFTSVGQTKRFQWRIPPHDRTPSCLEVWLPPPLTAASRVSLTVTSPTGASVSTLEGGPMVSLGYVQAYWAPWPAAARGRFVVIVQPTGEPDPTVPWPQLAPAGTWKIDLTHTGGLAASDIVQAWIRRDDQIYGFPLRGRQSYLNHADYERFDHAGRDQEADNGSLVQRQSTINSMATGKHAIVVGGYLGKERKLAKYTAAGKRSPPLPPPGPQPRWPDAAAVTEDSRVHGGVLATGSRSGSSVAMGGTSVAAPQVARRVASDLAMGGLGDRAKVQSWASVPLLHPERSGAGGIAASPIVKIKRFE